MRKTRWAVLASLILLGAVVPAMAEEIVHFTNGSTMAIRSHTVKDGMIHVDLGASNFMAFPWDRVERIEKAGRDVYLKASYSRANVTVATPDGDQRFPVSAADQVSASQRARRAGGSAQPNPVGNYDSMPTREGEYGIETGFPLSGHPNKKVRNLGVTGPALSAPGDPRMNGAQRRGSKWVMDGTTDPASATGRVKAERLTLRNPLPVQPVDTGSGSEGPGSGDGGATEGSGASGDGES